MERKISLNLFVIKKALEATRRPGIGIENLDASDVFSTIEGLEKLLQAVAIYNPEQAREFRKIVAILDEVAGTVQDINIEDNM